MPDNGAINQGSAVEGSCPTCEETPSVQCGIESAAQQCSTPFCDPRLGSLPKKTAARLVARSGECLVDNPTVPTVAPQVWQRGLDGIDRIAPLTSAMIPGKADSPCFTTIEEPAAGTFGKALMAQVDSDTGKTCIKQVPLEDTAEAYLAGYAAEDVSSGTPKIRPVRIIPELVDGCPDNIQMLGVIETDEEVQPGLVRTRPKLVKMNSPAGKTSHIPGYSNDDDVSSGCLSQAVWNNDGDCSTLSRITTAEGVIGAWAPVDGCLKFFEVPKDGSDYREDYVLAFIGGSTGWQWQPNGYQDGLQVLETINKTGGSAYTGVKQVYTLTDVPQGARFAIVAISATAQVAPSPPGTVLVTVSAYYKRDQSQEVYVGRIECVTNNVAYISQLADVPIIGGTIAMKSVIAPTGISPHASISLIVVGYR